MNVKFMFDQAFNGTVVNRTCHFIDEESIEKIKTPIDPLNYFLVCMGCSPRFCQDCVSNYLPLWIYLAI